MGSRYRIFMYKLWKLKGALIGGLAVGIICVCAIFAPYVAPHDPYLQQVPKRLIPPVWIEGGTMEYPLGTDLVGRDILSRLIYGSRVSLTVGCLSVILASIIGVYLGLIAGYYGRLTDTVVSTLVNIMLAFPFMLLALAFIAVLGPSFKNIIIILGITGWPMYTRPIRAEVLSLKQQEFVLAAKAIGMRNNRILFLQILPNVTNSIIVIASLEVARMIILESFLSFLGVGIQPPTPSWGGMLGEGRSFMLMQWWLAAFPGIAIFIATLGINLLGEGIRDIFDPRFKDI